MSVALPSCGARGAEPWQRRVWHGLQGRVQAEDVVGAGVVAGITEEEEVLMLPTQAHAADDLLEEGVGRRGEGRGED